MHHVKLTKKSTHLLVIAGCSAAFFSSFATAAGFTIGSFAFVFVPAAFVPLDFVGAFHAPAAGDGVAVVVGVAAAAFVDANDDDDADNDSDGDGSFLPTTPTPIRPLLLLAFCCSAAAPPTRRPAAATPPMPPAWFALPKARFCE